MASVIASGADDQPSKPVRLALNLVKADHALQPRVEMDDEHWNRMARAYVDGDDIPPPIHVFYDGKFYWLADGFHRYKAMWSLRNMGAKFTHIRAFVHEGTKQQAVVYAAQANLDNRSKTMNLADRKKAMFMLLDVEEWRKKIPGVVGKILGLNSMTSKTYWTEYFVTRSLEIPETAEMENGTIRGSVVLEDCIDVGLPSLGAGLGGLDFSDVEPVVRDWAVALSDRCSVTLYRPR